LRRLGVRHDVNLVRVDAAGFQPLPDQGLVEFLDPETGASVLLDTSDRTTRQSLEKAETARLEAISELARKARAVTASHDSSKDPIASVRTLVRRRAMAGGTPR
jgi:uncharacterized protein (DUF58 family)